MNFSTAKDNKFGEKIWKNFGKVNSEIFCEALMFQFKLEKIPNFVDCITIHEGEISFLEFIYATKKHEARLHVCGVGKIVVTPQMNEELKKIIKEGTS